jgi:hypothetical protein
MGAPKDVVYQLDQLYELPLTKQVLCQVAQVRRQTLATRAHPLVDRAHLNEPRAS